MQTQSFKCLQPAHLFTKKYMKPQQKQSSTNRWEKMLKEERITGTLTGIHLFCHWLHSCGWSSLLLENCNQKVTPIIPSYFILDQNSNRKWGLHRSLKNLCVMFLFFVVLYPEKGRPSLLLCCNYSRKRNTHTHTHIHTHTRSAVSIVCLPFCSLLLSSFHFYSFDILACNILILYLFWPQLNFKRLRTKIRAITG